ncbi:WD40 repeat domain-containing protein [Lentzea aerocolonigenes]|uniref:WD40 repeat domain-containing protein n=1 Tax=Lentzea aerocolonigenes TaxID=68170 RepID=UPI0004C2DD77|nr:WD40 repeat domain-containing protein [Lentzea aerocolonigenes]MCP2241721.1 WD40 repeat [Lentzea aerocolonigenes]
MSAGRQVNATALTQPGSRVSWAPDSSRLAIAAAQPGAWIGDFNTVGVLTTLPAEPGPPGWSVTNCGPVHDVAFSPDGQSIAVAGAMTGVVSAQTGALRFGFQGIWGESTAFSPNGRRAAWWGTDVFHGMRQILWAADVATGQQIGPWEWQSGRAQVVFSPDSRWIAAPGGTGIALVDLDNPQGMGVVSIDRGTLNVAFSPDGKWLAAGCWDGTIRLYSFPDLVPGPVVRPHPELQVGGVVFTPDSRWVAGVVEPGVGLYRVSDGTPRFPALADVPEASKVVFSPDLRRMAVNQTVGNPSISGFVVLDAATGAPLWQATASDRVRDVEFSPDGRLIAACGANADLTGFVRVHETGLEVSRQKVGAITVIEMSPAGTPFVAVADDNSSVTVLAAESGVAVARKPVPGGVSALGFADHSQSVVVGGTSGARLFSVVGDRSWKVEQIGVVNGLAVGGTAGEWIAVASGRTARLLRSLDGGTRWANPVTHPQTVTRVAISPDGRWVATGCVDRRTRLFNAETGAEVMSVEGDGKVFDLAFGAVLVTANEDGAVTIIDPVAPAVRARVTRNFACSLVALSQDGTLLATAWADNLVLVHDITGQPAEVRRLTTTSPVTSLGFAVGGTALCVASGGPAIVVSDVRTGQDLVVLRHPKPVRDFAFSADGALLATACEDDVVRVFAAGTP